MDRAEATGLGVATVGHVALLAVLTYGVAATRLPMPKSDPIEVAFVDEAALETTSPTPSAAEPAPLAGSDNGPPEPAVPAPPEVPQVPVPQPQPQPQPRAAPAPAPPPVPIPRPRPTPPPKASATSKPKASPAKPSPATPKSTSKPASGRKPFSVNIPNGGEGEGKSESAAQPAAKAGPAVEASLVSEVRRQLKPHWQRAVPTGADAEALRTELSLTLGRDGRVTGIDVVRTTGITASNRPQVALHQERARRAVTLASPFNLPDKYYDAWRQLNVTLDLRLSQ